MKYKLDIFACILSFLVASIAHSDPVTAQRVLPAPVEIPTFFATIAPIAPMESSPAQELKPLETIGFHFDAMGTHANPYPDGQCTHGAASMKGNVPVWGNASNWDDAARASGITVSDTPILGAIAQTDRGGYGHVAVVTGVYPDHIDITEMNYDYYGGVRTRPAAYSEFKYIYM